MQNRGSVPQVLIVDDNRTNLEVAKGMLESLGFPCRTEGCAQSALQALASNDQFQLVLIDSSMLAGEALRSVRKPHADHRGRARLSIVAMSTMTQQQNQALIEQGGIDAVICKPLSKNALAGQLERFCSAPVVNDEVLESEALAQLRELDSHQPGLLSRVATRFAKGAHERMQALRGAWADRDTETVMHSAHALKGESLYFGAQRVAHCAAGIEQRAKDGDLALLEPALAELERELSCAVRAIEKLVS